MAMRILATRVLQTSSSHANCNLPARVCLSASMSSSTPSASTSSKTPTSVKTERKVRRESFRSKLAQIFGGNVDPADPSMGTISADDANFPHIVEKATGEEKLLLLAFENGIIDPYCNLPVERNGRGSKDNPVVVESFFESRMVACICEESQNSHRYSIIHKGEQRRCSCGHWFKCVDAPRFWEKIPKEDLLDIQFFRELEEQGKLDNYLKTGQLDDDHAHAHGHH